ncbi:MAG TPA: hypothetical protein VGR37_00230, partial [Longimicrobiaceae bacterium]|nr:hypothetical protein [Longimicrobiaceae bacterium]
APGGSAAATLGGAALGWLAGGAGAGVTSGITYLLGPPAGAALGYNLSWRRSQRAPAAPPPEEGERPGPAQEGEGGAPF